MFEYFILSQFFENKCIGLRKAIPYFNTHLSSAPEGLCA